MRRCLKWVLRGYQGRETFSFHRQIKMEMSSIRCTRLWENKPSTDESKGWINITIDTLEKFRVQLNIMQTCKGCMRQGSSYADLWGTEDTRRHVERFVTPPILKHFRESTSVCLPAEMPQFTMFVFNLLPHLNALSISQLLTMHSPPVQPCPAAA